MWGQTLQSKEESFTLLHPQTPSASHPGFTNRVCDACRWSVFLGGTQTFPRSLLPNTKLLFLLLGRFCRMEFRPWVLGDFFFVGWFCLFRAAPHSIWRFPGWSGIGALAAGLHHSHSKARSEPDLRTTPQFTVTPAPKPTERGQGWNPQPHGSSSDSFPLHHDRNSQALGLLNVKSSFKEHRVTGLCFKNA